MSRPKRQPTKRETAQLGEHLSEMMNATCRTYRATPGVCMAHLMGMYAEGGGEDAIEQMQGYLNILSARAIQAVTRGTGQTSSVLDAPTLATGWAILKPPAKPPS